MLCQFKKIFDEISQHLEDILASYHFGVAVALAERCQKLGTRQKKYRNVSVVGYTSLNLFLPETRKRVIGKQYRHRSDSTVWCLIRIYIVCKQDFPSKIE